MNCTDKTLEYIETPRVASNKTAKINAILDDRMKEFMLSRRRLVWIRYGR